MVTGWIPVAALCASMIGGPQNDVTEERVPIRHISVYRVLETLRTAAAPQILGSLQWLTSSMGKELILRGDRKDIDQAREIIRLIDVVPKRVVLEVRLLRVRKVEGRITEEPITELKTLAVNNLPFTVSGTDESWSSEARIHPRINGDGSISLRIWFSLSEEGQKREFRSVAQRQGVEQQFVVTYDDSRGLREVLVGREDAEKARFLQAGYRVEAKVVEIR